MLNILLNEVDMRQQAPGLIPLTTDFHLSVA
jgi:hypothetical protein